MAYERAGGRCECLRAVVRSARGRPLRTLADGGPAPHHVQAVREGGSDDLDNCEALCIP